MKHLIHILIHALLWVGSQLASAEVHHFRVYLPDGYKNGSAVSVGKNKDGDYILLTSGHAFRGTVKAAYVGVGGKWIPVVLRKATINSKSDLAVCTFRTIAEVSCTKVATDVPEAGSKCVSIGVAENGILEIPGAVAYTAGNMVYTTAALHHQDGMSGGAIMNDKRECFAIISGFTGDRRHNLSDRNIRTTCLQVFGFAPS